MLKIKIFSSFNVNAFGLCVGWAHSYMNEIFMLARVRVNVMVDDCNLLFLLSYEKQKSVCCMTLKQSNNIFIVLSGKNFYATLDSQGKYHFLYFGLLGRFKICPPYLIDGRPHYPTAKQNYKNQFYTIWYRKHSFK